MDYETCCKWLRAELSRTKRRCLLRVAARLPGLLVLWLMQTTVLTLALTYFAALALVRMLHLPADDPWNRFFSAMHGWGWSIADWSGVLLGGFVVVYLLARVRRQRKARVLFTVDDLEPLLLLPPLARNAELTELRRSMPGPIDYLSAGLFALPRLAGSILADLASYNRLRRTDVDECASVVRALYGRGQLELKQLQAEVGRETVETAVPQLWDLPLLRFKEDDPQKLELRRIAEQDLLVFGVA